MKRILTAIIALFSTLLLSAQIVVRTETGVYYLPIAEVDSITFDAFPKRYEYFSVDDGRYVAFSPGNLQCTGVKSGNYRWSFATHQYDYIGDANISNGALTDHIDLFGWSTTNTATPWGISTSEKGNDYTGTFVDWGKNTIGYDAANTWRTLSAGEWHYLFYSRTNASSLYGFATVNGTIGLILLPDSWSLPSGLTFNAGTAAYTNNVYSTTQWSKMESAGAVFLPAAGDRSGTSVYSVQSCGYYWSSTVFLTSNAYALNFFDSFLYPKIVCNQYSGQSVRLVQDVSNIYTITCASVNHGTISAERTSAKEGQTVTFTITPETGYTVTNITITAANGSTITPTATSTANQYTFTMPADDVTISATCELQTYTITCNTLTGGTLTTDKTTSTINETVTITVAINAGYRFLSLQVLQDNIEIPTTSIGSNKYTFTMPAGNVTISATLQNFTFSITKKTAVLFAQGNLQYIHSSQTWRFADHQYDYLGAANIINNAQALADTIDLLCYSTSTSNFGTGLSREGDFLGDFIDWGKNIGDGNTWRTLTRQEWRYLLEQRTNADSLYGAATVNNIKGIILLPDDWKKPDNITISLGLGSSTYYTDNVYTIAQWQELEQTGAVFLPAAGCRTYSMHYIVNNNVVDTTYTEETDMVQLYGCYASDEKTISRSYDRGCVFFGRSYIHYSGNVDRWGGISVRLAQNPQYLYTITCDTPSNGSLTTNRAIAEANDVVTITATPNAGYAPQSVKVMNGTTEVPTTSIGLNKYTFVMPAGDVTISAIYSVPYSITCNTPTGGTLTADKTTSFSGETVTFTATPATSYELQFLKVMQGDTEITTTSIGSNQYTFTMPAGNVTISVTYIRIYTITCNTPTNGALTTDKTVCEENGTVTITATPNSGTKLQILTVVKSDGSIVTATAAGTDTYTFTMPASDVTISATYAYYFSISATQTVIFSRGNLQYQMRQGIWRFAKNQYDYIGKDNSQRKYTYSDTYIDLFGWGTGKNPTQNSSSNSDYSTFTDWGKNKIGSYPANTWRTLSQEEWQYLTRTRTGSQQRCGIATVNGIKGLIILPDVWNAPSGISFKYWDNSSYSNNVYDIDQWKQMEAAGAVFLPNAGKISESKYSEVGSQGYYWLSTENSTKAYQIQISSSSSFDTYTGCGYNSLDKYYGASVRLVQTGLVQERQDFSITCTTPTNGTLSADKTTAERYDVVTITATPASGYALQSLKVLQGTKEIRTTAAGTNTYTFVMPAGDVTISAIYSVPYSITCNTPTNGTLSVDKTTCAMTGTVTITTSPSNGYELESVKVMQGTTEITTTYVSKNKRTFAMPDGDVTVTATFKALNYTITCTNLGHGTLIADKTTGTIGETVTIKATTTAGYRIKTFIVNSGSTAITTKLTDTGTYTFTMPAGNVTVTATTTTVTFSVSPTARAVFAPGNLQYTQSTKKWTFAEHQYDIIGTANVSGSALADKIDLFGWSTNNATTAFGASNSTDKNLYRSDFVDWGMNTIGDDAANTWRTPTKYQWDYLLNTRTDAANRYGVARIQLNDDGSEYANGVIILPDDWECPTGITFKSGTFTTTNDNDDSNAAYDYAQYQTFTHAQWLQLEQAGAVFLPAASYRNGTTVSNPHRGYYRTCTPSSTDKAYMLRVCSNGVITKEDVRYEGYSVRLLQITKTSVSATAVFSVSASKKVIFAPGNLQYTQSTKKWSFAEHQYDILGDANVSNSALADKIDLFGWSTNNSNTAFGVSSSTTTNDYNGSFVDWGTNAIGDYAANTWSTPTKDEFDYLFNDRTDAASKYGVARIYLNDDGSKYANGVIILPDDWTCPTGITFKSGTFTTTNDDDDSNATYDYAQYQTFTLAQWQQLEQAGAVFLPAAAFRKGTALDKSHRGYYRTSTSGTDTNKAYMLRVCSNGIVTKEDVRREGYSVRLLQEVK